MKKVVLLTLALMVFGQSYVLAATVQSYGGSVEDGAKLVVTGLNFGTRADNGGSQNYLCRLWDNFDSGNFSNWNYTDGGSSWEILSTNNRVGSKYIAHKKNESPLDRIQIVPSSKSEYYVSFWMNAATNMPTNNNDKYFRAGSTSSNANLVWNSNSNSSNVQSTVEFAVGGTQVNYGSQSISGLKGTWNLVEIDWALPVLGSSKDFAKIWVNGKLVNNLPNSTDLWTDGQEMNNSPYIAIGAWFSTTYGIGDGWYFDDVYIDYTPARVVLGNANTFETSTHRELQIPTSWGNSSIEFTVNTGSFQPGDKAYIYVVDADGNPSNGLAVTIGGTGVADPVDPSMDATGNLRVISPQ